MNAAATEGPPWTLLLDREITRRKTYHQVLNDKGILVFSSRSVSQCIEFLAYSGQWRYRVQVSAVETDLRLEFWGRIER